MTDSFTVQLDEIQAARQSRDRRSGVRPASAVWRVGGKHVTEDDGGNERAEPDGDD